MRMILDVDTDEIEIAEAAAKRILELVDEVRKLDPDDCALLPQNVAERALSLLKEIREVLKDACLSANSKKHDGILLREGRWKKE